MPHPPGCNSRDEGAWPTGGAVRSTLPASGGAESAVTGFQGRGRTTDESSSPREGGCGCGYSPEEVVFL